MPTSRASLARSTEGRQCPSFLGMGMSDNGLKEFTKTKEMAAAWVFRILLSAITAGGLYILNDFKDTVKSQLSKLEQVSNKASELGGALQVLTQTVTDEKIQEGDILTRVQNVQQDHEQRLRYLERPSSPRP